MFPTGREVSILSSIRKYSRRKTSLSRNNLVDSLSAQKSAVEGYSAEQPPLLYIHSFYVFSMTLDAWASQFRSGASNNSNVGSGRAISPNTGSQTNVAKKPMTPAEQWAKVKREYGRRKTSMSRNNVLLTGYEASPPSNQRQSALSPAPKSDRPQMFPHEVSLLPSIGEYGRRKTSMSRNNFVDSQKAARQPSTAKSPIKSPSRNAGTSTRTGRSFSQKSSGYPTAISPGMKSDIPPILLTGYEASPPSNQRQSALSPAPKSDRPQMFPHEVSLLPSIRKYSRRKTSLSRNNIVDSLSAQKAARQTSSAKSPIKPPFHKSIGFEFMDVADSNL